MNTDNTFSGGNLNKTPDDIKIVGVCFLPWWIPEFKSFKQAVGIRVSRAPKQNPDIRLKTSAFCFAFPSFPSLRFYCSRAWNATSNAALARPFFSASSVVFASVFILQIFLTPVFGRWAYNKRIFKIINKVTFITHRLCSEAYNFFQFNTGRYCLTVPVYCSL